MKITNNKIKLGMFLLVGILLMISVSAVTSYSRANTQYISPTSSSKFMSSQGISLTNSFSQESCQAGQDFVVQISPLGCEPTVVRSDLLEEQNYPVFCQLSATKINPLIDVEAIESISFKGEYPQGVSGVGFHPANAGIKTSQSTLLNSPVLNNIGYAVVVLKKQSNESAMPDWVQGNMTAKIRYDVKNAFGIGKGTYYLPQISNEDWGTKYKQYGFWGGKGFLRADYIDVDSARVSIYTGEEARITGVDLEKGKTSGKINIPGFYCLASLQLRLDGLVDSDTRAKFEIDGETAEVIRNEKFLDNKCSVQNKLEKNGLYQTVRVTCRTDEGSKYFNFNIAPKVGLNIDGTEQDVWLGQKIVSETDNHIYVSYIGAKENSLGKVIDTNKPEDLIVYFYKSKTDLLGNLSSSKLLEINRKIETGLRKELDFTMGEFEGVKKGDSKSVFGKTIGVVGFAGAQNSGFSTDEALKEELEEYYERNPVSVEDENKIEIEIEKLEKEIGLKLNYDLAIKSYDEIINSYPSLKKTEDEKLKDVSYGEAALYEKIKLANEAGQKADASVFCEKFKEIYSASQYLNEVENACGDLALANSGSATWDVLINGEVKSIQFKGIYEPSPEEYSAEISVGGVDYVLTKNDIVGPVDKSFTVQLISLYDNYDSSSTTNGNNNDYAKVKVDYINEVGKIVSRVINLRENIAENFGNKTVVNTIVLRKINLQKQAKVSVIPGIENTGTEANFTFKIGIEKRAIQLSPEKINEKIKNLNETIEKWSDINEKLGEVVKGMKGACLATSAALTVKNFFNGFGGKAGARQDVTEMYRDQCKKDGKGGDKLQACLLENNANINRDVGVQAEFDTNRLRTNDQLSGGAYKEETLKDGSKVMVLKNEDILNSVDVKYRGLLKEENYNSELKDILYYQEMSKKGGIFKEKADKRLEEILGGLDEDSATKNILDSSLKEMKNAKFDGISIYSAQLKDQKIIPYNNFISPNKLENLEKGKAVQGILHGTKVYLLELKPVGGDNYGIVKIYDEKGIEVSDATLKKEIESSYVIRKVDEKSYNNKYDTPEVIYYEIGADKGRPAIVPVDVNKGFYAATNPGTSVMNPYDASGMPSYFYLCNVMSNGKQEFNLGKDDECVGVRVGSNKADGTLTGLNEVQTNEWARKAVTAMREASRQYKAGMQGKITILGNKVGIGNPASNLPGTQCEDFMSPADCAVMFNVCDPVICPESRCDFGGKYRVSNVIQSGIIGSTLLCLPNFGNPTKGGVAIPVCLTGIHAGIDSLLSVYQNYGDCLQENLDSGKTVGVCDEIHSIYLCEFLWKQGIPLSKLVMSKVTDFIFGGSKGGGEYLQVGEAFDNSAKSIDYMTNYYGANSFAAFKARSTDEVGSEVCKNFVSARYPASGEFFDALLEPDSPSQYSAWFHETSFTTATVPPTSQYKVFYHIYAGKDAGVYYEVYLKSPVGSSFYSDAQRVTVASGYIAKGDYASQTKDFIEVSGYKELCINVQGKEECGFKEVSTSFAMDYVQDQYVKDQAERTDIKSEKECISGSVSAYSMLTPNVQAGAEAVIDAQIYNQGIVRVCATSNPGDVERWVRVGTCGGEMNCYLDKDSVGEAVNFNASLGGLEKVTEDAMEKLRREGKYLDAVKFEELKEGLEEKLKKKDYDGVIKKVNEVLYEEKGEKVFFNREKVQLIYLKASAYVGLVVDKITKNGEEVVTTTDLKEPIPKKTQEQICEEIKKKSGSSLDIYIGTFDSYKECKAAGGNKPHSETGCCWGGKEVGVEVDVAKEEESEEEINKNYKVSKISLYVGDKEVNSINIPNNGDEISFRVRTGDNLYLSFEHNCYHLSLKDENEKLWYSSAHNNYFYGNYYGSKIDSEKKLILENNKDEKNLDDGEYKFKFFCVKDAQKQYLQESYVFNLIVE